MAEVVGGAEDGAQMLAGCRARDEIAWRRFYDTHFPFVYRCARRLGMSAVEAEDVVHEVFVVAFEKLHQFDNGRVKTWLYRITANIVGARCRKTRVREAFVRLGLWIGGQPPPSPERVAETTSAQRAVERVLQRMSPKKREVFALFELEGLSGDAIADRLGCSVNTVWTRLFHARKQFLKVARKLGCLEEDNA